MSEIHRALLVLLLAGFAAFRLAHLLSAQELPGAFALRRNAWFALTIAAFAVGNFWLFVLFAAGLLLWMAGRETNLPALFLGLLFVVPTDGVEIPGLGLVNFLFSLTWPRLLVLTLLLPVFVRTVSSSRPPQRGLARLTDLLFLGYVLVQLLLLSRESSLTSAMRGAFYVFVDLVVPYHVFSRYFDDVAKIRDAVAALVIAGLVLAAVSLFEGARHWLLYTALTRSWGSANTLHYLGRAGLLRAMGSTGHAIALGYVMAICLMLYLPLRQQLRPGWSRNAMLLLLAAGLLCALSRGPLVGAALGLVLYLTLGARPIKNLSLLAVSAALVLAALAFLPFGNTLLGLIPFFGEIEAGTIDYRQQLMENAAGIIAQHPFLGSSDYAHRLASMGMLQGQGIIDIVNTYVRVALHSGLVGLACFGGALLAALLATLRARATSQRALQRDAADLGRSLAAAQLTVIVTIVTVSSITVIPWVYWCLTGILVAYARIVFASLRQRTDGVAGVRFA